MLRENVEGTPKYDEVGIAERLQLGWVPDREPDIRDRGGSAVKTAWVQERENQLALLDTCFGALQPEESLCFFYAKRTPMSEQSRRVIVGVGRVLSVGEGHTLLPRIWIIRRARERALQPPCPLGENVLDASEERFDPVIVRVATGPGERAYQLDRLVQCRAIIRREVLSRKKGKPHTAEHDWRKHVDKGLDTPLPHVPAEREMEVLARTEKAVALEQLFRSRLCVLVGSAGTGKTTLLRMLCSMPGLAENGLLLLAPTGKARVRLEEQTKMRGAGQTLAQFLIHYQRYDGRTGAYFPNRRAPRCGEYRTVIVDECSMLTEEQLAALIDSLTNVERLVLVGDPRQLPPIGAGRPFVDIVKEVKPADIEERDPIYVETFIPRCGPSYAELTINQRQQGETRADRLLASHFSGLHQGSLAEYRRYAGDENSEIARRLTNLFTSPIPREVPAGGQQKFLEEGLIHLTERGNLVRSKSELDIADALFARDIEYAYEQPLVLPNDRTRYPDFTITDHARGTTFYWEHLGLLDDPGYRSRWERKRAEYLEAGIKPHADGGGTDGTLIETRGRLDSAAIGSVIDGVILD